MNSEDYYKEQYFYELQRRDSILDELNLPFAVLLAIFGALVALSDRVLSDNDQTIPYFVVGLAALSAVTAIGSGALLWLAWAEKKNYYPAASTEIHKYENKLIEYYETEGSADAAVDAERKLKQHILKEFIRCAGKNAESNDERVRFLMYAKRTLLVASFFTFVAYVLSLWS